MRQEVRSILLGCEQHEIGHALGHHGRNLNQIVGPALDVLSYELVDVAVQAVGHRVLTSLSVESPLPISRTNEQRGWWMRKARRGWTMPEGMPARCCSSLRSGSGVTLRPRLGADAARPA